MPPAPNSRPITNSPDFPGTAIGISANPGSAIPPLFETFGLSSDWQPAYEWATRNGVLAELLVIVDATLVRTKHQRLGTVLREITRPTAREYLEQWQATDPSALLLYRLSEAALTDKSILSKCPPLPTDSPAHIQLGEQVTRHYLFAVLLEQLPPTSPKERGWFTALRLWLLVHGVRRARANNLQDLNLQTVARAIRQACDRHLDWRLLVSSLATPALGFDEFNAFLRFRAESIQRDEKIPSSHQKFCRALIAISRNEHSPDESGIAAMRHDLLSARYPVRDQAGDIVANASSYSTGLEDDPVGHVWAAGEGGEEGIFEATVDPRESYFHQTLTANSILLLNAEDLQFLPWSYSRPNPHESAELDAWIDHLIASGSVVEELLGGLAWIARRTGHSLRTALDMPLSPEVADGWRVDPDTMILQRHPPLRHPGWQPKNDAERQWVAPIATMNRLRLPDSVARVLRNQLRERTGASVLGDLWCDAETPESTFRRLRSTTLARVTPGILGNGLPAYLYIATGDGALARLVSSHPKTGMPAACAYANWANSTVEDLLAQARDLPLLSVGGSEPPIGGGSRLDPIEALLLAAFQSAAQRLEQAAATNNLVPFHNAYAAYIAVVLFAATGGRPVHDPFEALAHFDFDYHFCFLNDKSSGEARENRLTPIPRQISAWLRDGYCQYLSLLAQALESAHPRLSADIASLRNSCAKPRMPFLFMLTTDAEVAWTSVSEKTIEATELFDWPLPLRLFRHRLAQRLRRRAVDPEVIDAILGHADNAVATHGDDSTRVWLDDMEAARPALEAAFADLRIPLITCQPRLVPPAGRSAAEKSQESPFGVAAREKDRQARSDQARTHAKQLIDEFLANRELPDLGEEDVDELARKLLFTERGLPRPLAYLYYDVFAATVNELWRDGGEKVCLKRRYAWAKPARRPFSDQACGAITLHRKLSAKLDEVLVGVQASRLSLRDSAALAIVLLCIDHRICDLAILRDVANGKHFRVATLKGRVWLEYSQAVAATPNDPDLAVRAFPISPQTASILDRLRHKLKNIDYCATSVPQTLAPIVEILEASGRCLRTTDNCSTLAEQLASLVDQVNVMTWPGVAAAYTAGRMMSWALGWRDRIRLEFGAPARFSDEERAGLANDDGPETSARERQVSGLRACQETDSIVLQAEARKFFKGLRLVVTGQTDSIDHLLPSPHGTGTSRRKRGDSPPAVATPANNQPSLERRRDITSLGRRYLRAWNGHVSTTLLLLGEWTVYLVARRSRGRNFLALSTIIRYLDALSPVFEDAGYDSDLMLMDEDDITDFYSQVLAARNLENSTYVGGRLREFHLWAARHGVEDPDWLALPDTVAGIGVSPGFLTETEYQTALRLLAHEMTTDPHVSLTHAFLLLGCYRFGLRGKECLGLRRDDWIDYGNGNVVLLVRNNRARQLKTPAGRRQVPLLFDLSGLEWTVIKRWMLVLESLHGDAPTAHMFASAPDTRMAVHKMRFTAHVNDIIKRVTDNPYLSLHHVRHTAANRIAMDLLELRSAPWSHACEREGRSSNRSGMVEILLGRAGPTRRTGWAMARYLGHAGPGTLYRNYLHLIDDWVRELQGDVLTKAAMGHVTRVHVLDGIPRGKPLDTQLIQGAPAPLQAVSVDRALQFMRLLAVGKDAADAAAAMRLPPDHAAELRRALVEIGMGMRLSPLVKEKKGKTKKGKGDVEPPKVVAEPKEDSLEFLRRVSRSAWGRLIRQANNLQEKRWRQPEGLASLASVKDAARMVGATRQLVMWEPAHFVLVRAVVDLLGIDDKRFIVVHSQSWSDRHREAARLAGFQVNDAKAAGGKRPLQLDSALDGDNLNRVEKRCVFVFEQNDDFSIRDRLEMVVAFIAVAAAILSPPPPTAH